MKLLKRPERIVTNRQMTHASAYQSFGAHQFTYVEIMCPDFEDPKTVVWHKLKYGKAVDLSIGGTTDRMDFPDDKLVLYGVRPYEKTRTNIWEGCVYKCTIDYFEER